MIRVAVVVLVVLGLTCATMKHADAEELKPAVEAFHQRLRWKDFRAAAELLVPEHRASFLKGRSKGNDDKDLFITDFQMEDALLPPEGDSARVVTKISWYRLPSATEQTATVTTLFVWREGKWLVESQDEGPFIELRPAPVSPRDAGTN